MGEATISSWNTIFEPQQFVIYSIEFAFLKWILY